ncbi:MAG: protein-disulfide reductase DsbD domain-containing protein, partial [Betaproteobacteria bacterium]
MSWPSSVPRTLTHLALAFFALLLLAPAHSQSVQAALGGKASASAVVTTEQVRAELLAHAPQGIGPGRAIWLGLRLAHQDGWHTYWKNPGDSGLPTTLQWALPAGVQAGEIAWPTPKKIPLGDLANYGYEGTVLLPVPLNVDASFKAERLELRLQASWLVCRRECIPQDGQFVLSLPTQSSSASHGPAFEAALAAQPRALAAGESRIEVREQTLQIVLAGLPAEARGRTLELFAETAAIIEPAAAWQQTWEGPLWKAQVALSKLRSDGPRQLPLVLALPGGRAWRIDAPVSGSWPPPAAAATLPPALDAALKAAAQEAAQRSPKNEAAGTGWLLALLGALLGGMILNLMPCVFPVLAIKALGFSQQRGDRLQQGLAYTAGVLLSFVALGALLLALRAGGEQLGWGFQLQNPAIVAALAILFTLIGLNLAGLFEFTQLAPGRLAALQWRHPAADAALSGVLAVAIASPCTAPFMGASLGAALSLPAWQGLAIFAALGLGMALPYLLISAVPALGRALPRPGPWMLRLKQVMAFPMLATVIWLLWVLGQQSGIDGVAALMVVLLLM